MQFSFNLGPKKAVRAPGWKLVKSFYVKTFGSFTINLTEGYGKVNHREETL